MRAIRAMAERWAVAGWRADLLLAIAAGVGYAVLAQFLFHGRAGNIDEVVTRWQAMLLLDGRLAVPVPAHPESVLARFTGIGPAGIIGQFPIGTVLAMAPFLALGVHWLTGAAWGALALFCWARLVRRLEPDAPTALAAVLLLAISPFYAGQSATQLGHVPVLALMLMAGLALSQLLTNAERATRHAALLGLAIGAAAMVRPVDAIAAALPAALLVTWFVARRRLPMRVVPAGLLGVMGPLALLLGSNAIQTGSPTRFSYEQVWGPAHRIGFHAAPYGEAHTPARGMRLVRGYLREIGRRAWATPVSALIPVALGLLLGALAIGVIDAWMLLTAGALLIGYWAYWHDGEWVGPRFVLPLMPLLALWTARVPRLLARWHPRAGMAGAALLSANLAWGLGHSAPPWMARYATLDHAVAADVSPLLDTLPPEGLVIVHDERRRADAARLRLLGTSASEARQMAERQNWCDLGWNVRRREDGDSLPPPTPPSWTAWCADSLTWTGVAGGQDASGAILLGSTPRRPVVRDLGARTALLADSMTLRHRTVRLVWEDGERTVPRLVRFDYDSALAAWARENAAYAAGRREAGR